MAYAGYPSDRDTSTFDKRWRWVAIALTLACGLLVFWELDVYDEAWNACPFTTGCKDNVVDAMDTSQIWAYVGGGAGIGAMLLQLHPRNRGLRIGLIAVAGVVLLVRIGIAMSV
ncbi:hypothetical protein RCO28_30855 [Streptomyces sp. LHD-70]|uniref:hypothetical protein n=1 Tax=Streptomyces sp. LHD-70 TaxID=3072140 RepID=UPI00280E94C5|nr:hypothetical protein [Streptomyces sp. LHD-70]MDQ8706837.1 hypothetical protein [Streptomyces sp. LHD-70]